MMSENTYSAETSNYWNIIKDVKDEIKIRLITLLSESLANSLTVKTPAKGKEDDTEKFIKKYYGVWQSQQTPEEIMDIIKEGRTSKDPVSFD